MTAEGNQCADSEEYIAAHIDAEPPHLLQLRRRTYLHHLYPRMCSGHVQGRLLKMLAAMIRPRRVLELGTFTGYSALCIAEGMAPGTVLDTVEIDDEKADELTNTFAEHAPQGVEIRLHIGDAMDVVPAIGGAVWDMVFIDADKRRYADYLEMVLPHVVDGGFILADNTLWDGHAAAGADSRHHDGHTEQTRGIVRFNDIVAADMRLEKVILPVRDGLTVIRKIPTDAISAD